MATTTQRGLGKGLSALISEHAAPPSAGVAPLPSQNNNAPGINSLPLNKLHSGNYQPRSHFDEGKLVELSESIRANGIMQPIIVRPSESQTGKYEIIAGERRWRASKIAGLNEVPVIIREISDKQALELALVENIQRQDLTPLEEANGYQRLIEEFDYSQEALASAVGKSRSHVANLLRLLSLPQEVKDMLDRGELTMGHARALLTAPNPVELAQDIVKRGLNVRQTEQYGREVQGKEKKPVARGNMGGSGVSRGYKAPAHKDPDILSLEETLSENLGMRVSINDRGQSGEIVLAYDSLSQLDEILRRLGDSV